MPVTRREACRPVATDDGEDNKEDNKWWEQETRSVNDTSVCGYGKGKQGEEERKKERERGRRVPLRPVRAVRHG